MLNDLLWLVVMVVPMSCASTRMCHGGRNRHGPRAMRHAPDSALSAPIASLVALFVPFAPAMHVALSRKGDCQRI